MSGKKLFTWMAIGLAAWVSSLPVQAGGGEKFRVTVTNLTRTQTFTPILVASHRGGVSLFTPGEPASDALAALAEGGDTVPLTGVLEGDTRVVDVNASGDLLGPGESVTVKVSARRGAKFISLAAMLIPTNDGFISLNGVRAPQGNETLTVRSPAYDAGSEPNDELCINIPGPVCGGAGGSPGVGGEGYVHIHGGIHGIGGLDPSLYDWRNPVAEITIRRVH
jgi:hypothetical protein